MPGLRLLLAVPLLALVACASAPPVQVSAYTWRQVDRDIAAASRSAASQAREQALAAMDRWLDLVYRKTDTAYIPWFSSYWTQRWLGFKVAWYKLDGEGERDETVSRLAQYLQEQYQDLVLEPVARDIAPPQILQQSTQFYLRQLDQQLPGIAQRHGIPAAQFDQHLQAIAAIAVPPGASLYQVLRAKPLERLPAYAALIERIGAQPGNALAWSAHPGISQVTRSTSERLVDDLTTSGAASVISSMVGRAAGLVVSIGASVFRAMVHERERPVTEMQLRRHLNDAFDEQWLALVRDPERGVMAGIEHLSRQIEASLGGPGALLPRYRPVLADGQPLWREP
jgi:FAD/FMN-containing dehydrogenase